MCMPKLLPLVSQSYVKGAPCSLAVGVKIFVRRQAALHGAPPLKENNPTLFAFATFPILSLYESDLTTERLLEFGNFSLLQKTSTNMVSAQNVVPLYRLPAKHGDFRDDVFNAKKHLDCDSPFLQ